TRARSPSSLLHILGGTRIVRDRSIVVRERSETMETLEGQKAVVPAPASPDIARYVTLFNARDWDTVRTMLAEDVRLDLVSRRPASALSVAWSRNDAVRLKAG